MPKTVIYVPHSQNTGTILAAHRVELSDERGGATLKLEAVAGAEYEVPGLAVTMLYIVVEACPLQ